MMTIPASATPKHMPTPINRTTSTARIASSRAAILIRLMAPNDTPNNTAVPGFFMVQQDYHTVRSPLRTGLVLALLARLAVIDPTQRLPFAAHCTRCPLVGSLSESTPLSRTKTITNGGRRWTRWRAGGPALKPANDQPDAVRSRFNV